MINKFKKYFKRNNCRLCNSNKLKEVFQLQPTPPANAFVSETKTKNSQERFPLEISFCNTCNHVQLANVLNPEILFKDYVYVSGTSSVFVNHFEEYANSLIKDFSLSKNDFVLDIGSNDGTLLSFFKKFGLEILGVDPAENISKIANQKGIKTICDFFLPDLASSIKQNFGEAKIITANNVFAHSDELMQITNGVRELLSKDGVFVFEVSYLLDVYEKTLFDTIYHEHLSYHSIKPLETFFKKNGMDLFKVKRINTHGGSIRVYVQLTNGPHPKDDSVEQIKKIEDEKGLYRSETFFAYGNHIDKLKNKLLNLLTEIKLDGKKIAGYGAPAKATTLMYQFGLGLDFIDYIVDDNPLKQGLYTPGLHVPVKTKEYFFENKPDYLLILAWNFAKPIIENNEIFSKSGGKFIIPLPDIQII